FFSSRRRHTRCLSDWSSDVCSSDLAAYRDELMRHDVPSPDGWTIRRLLACFRLHHAIVNLVELVANDDARAAAAQLEGAAARLRSEERRVGKEGGCRGSRWS